jgi:hypothetical protein
MASVSGSRLEFVAPNEKSVNLILSDGKTVTGSTVPGSFNIEIFTTGSGSVLPGVAATATIGGAVKISGNTVQAATLTSTEKLGAGSFLVIDETGGEKISLGTGAQTVIGSTGDTIVGGNVSGVRQVIDLTGTNSKAVVGPMTAIGGAGSLLVEAGNNDSITGGAGPTTVSGSQTLGGKDDDRDEGKGSHGRGKDDDRDEDSRGRGDNDDRDEDKKGHHTVRGSTASHDTITGGSGPLSVSGVNDSKITTGTGPSTVIGGNNDTITDAVGGALLLDIESRSKIHGESPSIAGSGAETVNLGAGHGPATFRDISVPGGTGPLAATTVMGFSTPTDFIASKTSVSAAGQFLGTSSVSAGNTVLTFVDGTAMTLVGITDISKVTFTG